MSGLLVASLLFLAVAIYVTDYRAYRAGVVDGRLEEQAEQDAAR